MEKMEERRCGKITGVEYYYVCHNRRIHIPLCRAQAVVAHNLSEVQSRENLKGRIKRNDWKNLHRQNFRSTEGRLSFFFSFSS